MGATKAIFIPGSAPGSSFYGDGDSIEQSTTIAAISEAHKNRPMSAKEKLSAGQFETAARSMGRLEVVYDTLSPNLNAAAALHTRLATSLELGRNLGYTSSVDIVLAHYKATREFKDSDLDALYQSYDSTHLTHVPPILFEIMCRHPWVEHNLSSSQCLSFIMDIEDSFKRAQIYAIPRVRKKAARISSFKTIIETLGAKTTLMSACDTWLEFDAAMSNHIFWRACSLLGLVAGLSVAGLVPYPALDFFGSFSDETLVNRKGRDEKLSYLAGCLKRSADKSLKLLTALKKDVSLIQHSLREHGHTVTSNSQLAKVIPQLIVYPVFTVSDIVKTTGASHSQARRLCGHLLKAGVIANVSGKSRYRRFRTHKYSFETVLKANGSLFFG